MFFYLKPTSWTPKADFLYAIKVAGDLHPCTYQTNYNDESTKFEAFIRGIGWKKAKKGYKIPVFKGETLEEMQAYIEQHGKYCLFFSITGFELNSGDCVVWAMQQEFNVALSIGFEYVSGFVKRLNDLNAKIQKIVMDKYQVDVLSDKMQWTGGRYSEGARIIGQYDLFYVKPAYSLMAYFLTKPHLDVVNDDSKLEKHYKAVVGYQHIEANPDEFPVSMKERLEFLFSKEVAKDYEKMMKEVPMG